MVPKTQNVQKWAQMGSNGLKNGGFQKKSAVHYSATVDLANNDNITATLVTEQCTLS